MKAVEKEMRQLHDRAVMIPVHKKCLTPEQHKEALAYLMFLKRMCRRPETEGIRCQGGINGTYSQHGGGVPDCGD